METTILLATLLTTDPSQSATPVDPKQQVAVLCFFKGDEVSGMNKICYYDCLGSLTAITIKSFQLCPLTIQN